VVKDGLLTAHHITGNEQAYGEPTEHHITSNEQS
jgi:hypothetical protein